MKKIIKAILTLIVVALTISCTNISESHTIKDNITDTEWLVIEIDSCEYIYRAALYQSYFAHKGNCKYCEKRRKEERK